MLFKFFLRRNIYSLLTIKHWLLISCGFSCLLLIARVLITGQLTYIFLVWNLFLAFLPFAITEWLWELMQRERSKPTLFAFVFTWLLFVPNSFYILTDLFHLEQFHSAPKWFDLLLIFSFAWNGILCGVISLRRVEIIIMTLSRTKNISLFLVFVVMWLSAFGIYIGRYLRFNSWDIVTDPFSLAGEILNMIIHPFQHLYPWGMTLCYSIFMTFLYFTIKKMSESFPAIK